MNALRGMTRGRKGNDMEKAYIYNENCVSAGQTVPVTILSAYDGDLDDAGDWHSEEVSEANARALYAAAGKARGGHAGYLYECALALAEMLFIDLDDHD